MKTTQLSKNKINVNKYPKTKKYVNLYFHAHQPYRLSNYSIFDIGTDKYYFWGPEGQTNSEILDRVSNIGYLKANDLMLELIKTSGLKVSYSLSGVLLEQFEEFEPWMVDKFQEMIDTSKVELIGETYYHSLAFFYSKSEFARHVNKHREIIWRLFRERPQVFRNTELTYRNDVGEFVREMGFKGIYAEGWDPILGWRSPNYIYKGKHVEFTPEEKETARSQKQGRVLKDIKLLLKNYRRSDDIAFRFQLKGWEGYPVTADKFAHWIDEEDGELINLCMDYETIGEHHREDSGIFEFYRHLPSELAKKGVEFVTASEALQVSKGGTNDEVDFPYIVSWADHERDLSAWMGNKMQEGALESIYKIEPLVQEKLSKLKTQKEKEDLEHTWGKLQTSDHFYYMSTKYWSDGDVHKYFSPFNSPYEAYINFMNVLRDFKLKHLESN